MSKYYYISRLVELYYNYIFISFSLVYELLCFKKINNFSLIPSVFKLDYHQTYKTKVKAVHLKKYNTTNA